MMESALAVVIGVLFACAVYQLLQPNLLRMIFGLMILSNAVNLLIVTAGRLTRGQPALIEEGAAVLAEPYANPLPQALTLTAVVISFGLISFVLVLAYRSYAAMGTIDMDEQTRED